MGLWRGQALRPCFVRCRKRLKDGKEHHYWSVVESCCRRDGRVVQRQVLHLGEPAGGAGELPGGYAEGAGSARRPVALHLPHVYQSRAGSGSVSWCRWTVRHDWFEGEPRCMPIVFDDDATSRLLALRFFAAETTAAYVEMLRGASPSTVGRCRCIRTATACSA